MAKFRNIDLLKLASEASQENFEKIVFLTTKYEQIVKLEHLLCPKVGGGGGGAQTHLCPPLLKVGRHVPPPLPPFSYALENKMSIIITGLAKQNL